MKQNHYYKIRLKSVLPMALLLSVLLAPLGAFGQRLIPEVQVNVDQVPQEAQAKLEGLDMKLQDYLERKRWGSNEYRYDLNVRVSIYFTDYIPGPPEDKFKASLIVTNLMDANAHFEDRRWDFSLAAGYQFRENEYSPLISMIEFYIWMVYGIEYDKLEKLGGRRYLDKARDVILQSNRSFFVYGWDKRNDLLRDYISTDNTIPREMSFFWSTGRYFYEKNDYPKAKDYLYYTLVKLEKVPVGVQNKFLESNYQELGEMLVRVGYANGLKKLKRIDPGRASEYNRILTEGGKP